MAKTRRCRRWCWILIVAGLASGCYGGGLEGYDEAFCEAAVRQPDSLDVMEWLRISSSEPKHLSSLSLDESLAFAHRLDSAGAKRLMVVGLDPKVASIKPALVVELPNEANARRTVFELYAKQVRNDGYEPLADLGQKYLYLPPAR